jgi:anti-anti-sigma regulatory factor
MLRVTVEEKDDQIVFRVEGKLKGPWVTELERCWRSTTDHGPGKTFVVDLDDMDFVDDQGKALLRQMAEAGVELIASGLMMRPLVEKITAANGMNSMGDASEHSSKHSSKGDTQIEQGGT